MQADHHHSASDSRHRCESKEMASDGKPLLPSIDRANREMLSFHGQQHRAARLTGIAPTSEGLPTECFTIVRLLEGNNTCIDRNPHCHQGGLPEYAAIEFGILLCRRCAFRHLDRNKEGVSVKNLKSDQWKLSEVLSLLEGGNGNYERYFNLQSPRNHFRRKDDGVASPEQMLDRRYTGKSATNYRQQLMDKVRKAYADREQLIQLYFQSQRAAQRRGRHDFESLNESFHSHSSLSDEASLSDRSPPPRSVKFGNLPDHPPQREQNHGAASKTLSPLPATTAASGNPRVRKNYTDQSSQPRSNAIRSATSSNEALNRVQLMQVAASSRRSGSGLVGTNGSGSSMSSFTSLRSLRDSGVKPVTNRRVAATAAFAQYQRLTGK